MARKIDYRARESAPFATAARPLCMRKVAGSNPAKSTVSFLCK